MAYGDLPADAPHKPNKGVEGGACNRQSCQAEPAMWYNHATLAWYCEDCRNDIEFDEFNLRDWRCDWQPKCGHPMFETRPMMTKRELAEALRKEVEERMLQATLTWPERTWADQLTEGVNFRTKDFVPTPTGRLQWADPIPGRYRRQEIGHTVSVEKVDMPTVDYAEIEKRTLADLIMSSDIGIPAERLSDYDKQVLSGDFYTQMQSHPEVVRVLDEATVYKERRYYHIPDSRSRSERRGTPLASAVGMVLASMGTPYAHAPDERCFVHDPKAERPSYTSERRDSKRRRRRNKGRSK